MPFLPKSMSAVWCRQSAGARPVSTQLSQPLAPPVSWLNRAIVYLSAAGSTSQLTQLRTNPSGVSCWLHQSADSIVFRTVWRQLLAPPVSWLNRTLINLSAAGSTSQLTRHQLLAPPVSWCKIICPKYSWIVRNFVLFLHSGFLSFNWPK